MDGRPFARGVDRRFHRRRNQSRCHRTTVSGRTKTTAVRQFFQMRRRAIQNSRSRPRGEGAWSAVSSPSAAAAGPGSPAPILDLRGAPAPTPDRRQLTAPACRDRRWRGRRNQLGRVLARVSGHGLPHIALLPLNSQPGEMADTAAPAQRRAHDSPPPHTHVRHSRRGGSGISNRPRLRETDVVGAIRAHRGRCARPGLPRPE